MPDQVFILLFVMAIMLCSAAIPWVIMRQARLARREFADAERLESDNGELRREMAKLTDRVAVLERIATDPAARTALEIESLRALPRSQDPGHR